MYTGNIQLLKILFHKIERILKRFMTVEYKNAVLKIEFMKGKVGL